MNKQQAKYFSLMTKEKQQQSPNVQINLDDLKGIDPEIILQNCSTYIVLNNTNNEKKSNN